KPRPGPRTPDGWRGVFLAYLEQNGTLYRAARAAGVSDDTVRRERARDPDFDRAADEALQLHADPLEEELGPQPGVVGKIVRLKAIRPDRYIERQAVVNINAPSNEIAEVEARRLLQRMIASCTEATRRVLMEGGEDLPDVSRPPDPESTTT